MIFLRMFADNHLLNLPTPFITNLRIKEFSEGAVGLIMPTACKANEISALGNALGIYV